MSKFTYPPKYPDTNILNNTKISKLAYNYY